MPPSHSPLGSRRSLLLRLSLALVAVSACGSSDPRERYIGNWKGPSHDILITPSMGVYLRASAFSSNGTITKWEGDKPVIEASLGLFGGARTIAIDRAPYLDGADWKMDWDGVALTRAPDHAPFAVTVSEGFDRPPKDWDTSGRVENSSLPPNRRDLIGHWRGLQLDLVIAQDGQIRGFKRGSLGTSMFDGSIEEWTSSSFVVRRDDDRTLTFRIAKPPHEKDGRVHLKLNAMELVQVYDLTPVGVSGEGWRGQITALPRAAFNRECRQGNYNACILLSQALDFYSGRSNP